MQRFMKNTKTGVIFPYDSDSMRLGRKNLVECNAAGVPVGVPDTSIDDLVKRIDGLEKDLAAVRAERDLLASRLAQAENKLREAEDPTFKRRRELESKKLDELRSLADALGIPDAASMKKAAVIDAIMFAEAHQE